MRSPRSITVACFVLLMSAAPAQAQSDWALEFDGTDDYVEFDDPVNVSGPLTIEAWIRPDALDGGRIVSNRAGGLGYGLDVSSSERLRLAFDGSVRGYAEIWNYVGQWIHVAATWTGPLPGDIVMYVNGEVANTDMWNGGLGESPGTLSIGRMAGTGFFFDGAIDEVRIFDAVVDPATIKLWSTRVFSPSHPYFANAVAVWTMEEGIGQSIFSAAGPTGRDGQLGSTVSSDSADPTWVSSGMVGNESATVGEVKARYR